MHEPQPQVTVVTVTLGQPSHGWVQILDTEMASAKGREADRHFPSQDTPADRRPLGNTQLSVPRR